MAWIGREWCFAGRWAIGCIAALCLGGGSAVAQIVSGPEIDMPFLIDHYYVSLAVLDDGAFALAGTTVVADSSPYGSHAQFEVQRYSPAGRALGNAFVPVPLGDTGSVGSLGDDYFISWRQTTRETSLATLLGGGGDVRGEPFRWTNSEADFYALSYRYGGPPGYPFLPISYQVSGLDKYGNPIYVPRVQAYGAGGQPLGHPATLIGLGSDFRIDDAAIGGDGRFVVVEDLCGDLEGSPRYCGRSLQLFHSSGRPATPPLSAGVPPLIAEDGTRNSQSVVAVAAGGNVLMMWTTGTQAHPNNQLMARSFDAQGAPAMNPFIVTQAEDAFFGAAEPCSLADGAFVLSWEVVYADGSLAVEAARLDAQASSAEPITVVPRGFQPVSSHLFMVNARGMGIVAWVAESSLTGGELTGHLKFLRVGGDRPHLAHGITP